MTDILRNRAEVLAREIESHSAHIEWEVWQASEYLRNSDMTDWADVITSTTPKQELPAETYTPGRGYTSDDPAPYEGYYGETTPDMGNSDEPYYTSPFGQQYSQQEFYANYDQCRAEYQQYIEYKTEMEAELDINHENDKD